MEALMQEEHKTRFDAGDARAKGYADAVLQKMRAMYDDATHPADHARIAAVLRTKQDVLNRVAAATGRFPGNVWPHVAAASATTAAAAAAAAAAVQQQVEAGVGMPGVLEPPGVCMAWMNKFLQERMEPGGPTTHRFKAPVTIAFDQAKAVLTRVQVWKARAASKGPYEAFENKLRAASEHAFDPLYRNM
jgi:hypothetical protein